MFGRKKTAPLISVNIPVYNTEKVLERCLKSVAEQDFIEKEVVIVIDASKGKDGKGRSAEKIARNVLKKAKVPFRILTHNSNLGILETRRDAFLLSRGEYIFALDSDDFLENPKALSILYDAARKNNADIVNSSAIIWSKNPGSKKDYIEFIERKINNVSSGLIEGRAIFDDFFINGRHSGFLWGKLIRKSLYKKAFDCLPFTMCTLGEDIGIYFFISLFAQRYFGIEEKFYRYSVDDGMTTNKKIDNLEQWTKNCSASSIITVLATYVEAHPELELGERAVDLLKRLCNSYVRDNLIALETRVVPELKQECRNIMEELWGASYVKRIEDLLRSCGEI